MTDKKKAVARKTWKFHTIEEAIDDIREGRMVILIDDEDRENEGDLTIGAEKVTPETINFMARYGRGLICLSLTPERVSELPNVQTMVEQGINATYIQPRGFWMPPNMPDYAVKFWEETLYKLYQSKSFKDFLKKSFMEPSFMKPAETKVFVTKFLKELKVDVDELGAFKKKK